MQLEKAMNFVVPGISASTRPTHEERFNRAMHDLDALELGEEEQTGVLWLFVSLKRKVSVIIARRSVQTLH